MKTHKDLEVWQAAVRLAVRVYEVSRGFPDDERFGLTGQMRRAAVSVASNIAEGAARRTDKEFLHFLYTAAGSASELDTHLEIAAGIQLCDAKELEDLRSRREQVSRMLCGLVRSLAIVRPATERLPRHLRPITDHWSPITDH